MYISSSSSILVQPHSRSVRPAKKSNRAAAKMAMSAPVTRNPSCPATAAVPKPMRPLTAYHIYFQIEREWLIQTAAGEDADKSIHDGKSYLPDVPRRYRSVKLLPDWYAGPGKRRKRKHRKSHGKIGFLELSQIISKRWATLEVTDPETKRYVSRIAARELAGYKEEMRRYKELTEGASSAPVTPSAVTSAVTSKAPRSVPAISPLPSPTASSREPVILSAFEPLVLDFAADERLASVSEDDDSAGNKQKMTKEAVDYSICSVSVSGCYIPCPGPRRRASNLILPDGSICDPLFELDSKPAVQQAIVNRCVSPASTDMDDIFQPMLC